VNYEEAKAQGFKYVTRNQLGGECVHKTKPERKGGYWESPGWRYIQGGTACPEKNVIMAINVAINIQNRQQEALKLAAQARKRAKKETRKRTGRRVCKTCKREFDAEHGSISYCSDLCMMIGKRRNNAKWKAKQRDEVPPELGALVTCKQCGQKFHRSRHYIAYCSNACREAARIAKRPMHSKTCTVCGAEFKTTDGRRQYCSKKCQSAAKSQQTSPAVRICKECGKEFKPSHGRKYCSAECSYAGSMRLTREAKRRKKANQVEITGAANPKPKETKSKTPIFKKCKECHRVFKAGSHHQVYCSIKCSEKGRARVITDNNCKRRRGVFYR